MDDEMTLFKLPEMLIFLLELFFVRCAEVWFNVAEFPSVFLRQQCQFFQYILLTAIP